MAFEVITTIDKAKRDAMFQDLRRNGNHMERQAVKFSGSQECPTGSRGRYQSTWSVAYPVTPDLNPRPRTKRRLAAERG